MAIAIINKADSMSMGLHLPLVKAVLSLLCPTPAVPLLALVPRPGFNGHKPSSSFIEGEGRLDHSAINKINMSVLTHSPEPETVLAPFISKPVVTLRAPAPYPSPCPLHELLHTMGPRQRPNIVSACCGRKEGSYAPEPLGVLHARLPGSMPDKWLLWKPPDVMETKQHSGNVVELNKQKMSVLHSPVPSKTSASYTSEPAVSTQVLIPPQSPDWPRDTVLAPCGKALMGSLMPEPSKANLCHPLGLKHEQRPRWRLSGMKEEKRRLLDLISKKNDKMSAVHSPKLYTVLLRSTHEPAILLWNPFPHC
jgi:hypothetical protein